MSSPSTSAWSGVVDASVGRLCLVDQDRGGAIVACVANGVTILLGAEDDVAVVNGVCQWRDPDGSVLVEGGQLCHPDALLQEWLEFLIRQRWKLHFDPFLDR